jgi:hypothetical protein
MLLGSKWRCIYIQCEDTSTTTSKFTIDIHEIRQILCLFVLRRVGALLGRVQHKFQELNFNFIDFRKSSNNLNLNPRMSWI